MTFLPKCRSGGPTGVAAITLSRSDALNPAAATIPGPDDPPMSPERTDPQATAAAVIAEAIRPATLTPPGVP